MRALFILIIILLMRGNLYSQYWSWAEGILPNNLYYPAYIAADAQGNLYSYATHTMDFYHSTKITKRDVNGNVLWLDNLSGWNQGNMGRAAVLDSEGNFYVCGLFSNLLVFAGDTLMTSGWRPYLASYDKDGNERWIRDFPFGGQWGNLLAIDSEDQLLVADVDMYYNLRLTKIDAAGTELWNRFYPSSGLIKEMRCDAQDNIYLLGGGTGVGLGGSIAGPDSLYSAFFFLALFDPGGNVISVESLPGVNQGHISPDAAGNIYMTGMYEEKMRIRQYTFQKDTCLDPYPCTGYFMAKLNVFDSCSWAHEVHPALGGGQIAATAEGSFYVTGGFQDSLSSPPVLMTDTNYNLSTYLIKYNTDGMAQWGQKSGGDGINYPRQIFYNGHGRAYISGYYKSRHYYPPLMKNWFGSDTLAHTGNDLHGFVAGLYDLEEQTAIYTADPAAPEPVIFPNPSSGDIQFQAGSTVQEIRVYDTQGRMVKLLKPTTSEGLVRVSELDPGIYFLYLRQKEDTCIRKFIRQ